MVLDKKKIILIVAVVIIAAGLVFYFIKFNEKNYYSVVYLSSGEVYVGKLRTFPGMTLTDGYILATTKDATDPNKNNFQLNPIKDALWAPKSIHLVKQNVIFYGALLPTSQIAQTLAKQVK